MIELLCSLHLQLEFSFGVLKAYIMLVDAIIGTIHHGYHLNHYALSTLQTLHFKITPYNTYTTCILRNGKLLQCHWSYAYNTFTGVPIFKIRYCIGIVRVLQRDILINNRLAD